MQSVAEYVFKDKGDNEVYFDGAEHWVVLEDGSIKSYEK